MNRYLLRLTLLVVVALCSAPQAVAQHAQVDSALVLSKRADSLVLARPDSALAYYGAALRTLRAARDREDEARVLTGMGAVYQLLGRTDSALACFDAALTAARTAGRRDLEGAIASNVGVVYMGLGQSDSALAYYREALRISRADTDRHVEAGTLNNIGRAFANLRLSDSALAYYRSALPISRELGLQRLEATVLDNIGEVLTGLGRPDSGLGYFRAALLIQGAIGAWRTEAELSNRVGGLFEDLGQPDSALAYFRLAQRIGRAAYDRAGEGAALHNIGVVFEGAGRQDSALAYYRAALLLQRGVGAWRTEAAISNRVGDLFQDLGQPDSALAYFRATLRTGRAAGDSAVEGAALSNIGGVFHSVDREDSALAYYHAALPILRAIDDRDDEALALMGMGAVYGVLERRDSALVYARAALRLLREVGDSSGEAAAMFVLAAQLSGVGWSDSALAYDRAALHIERSLRDRSGEGQALKIVGLDYSSVGQLDSALAYLRAALPLLRAAGNRIGEGQTLSAMGMLFSPLNWPDSTLWYSRAAVRITHDAGLRMNEAMSLEDIAQVYQTVPPLRSLPRAVGLYDTAAALIASMRAGAGSEANRIAYAERQTYLSWWWAMAWLGREAEVGPQVSALAALAAAERGRAQALLDLLQRTADSARGMVGIGGYLTRPGADLALEAESLVAPLRRTRTAALSYLVTPDTLVVWLVTVSGEVRVVGRVPVSADTLRQWVAYLRTDLGADSARGRMARDGGGQVVEQEATRGGRRKAGETSRRAAGRLAQWLVPEVVVDAVPVGAELVIVPHGVLGLVPFALLPVGAAGEPLGLRNALRYVPSLASLRAVGEGGGVEMTGPARRQTWRGALVVGNPAPMPEVVGDNGMRGRLQALPGAEQEADSVALLLGAKALVEEAATETAVRARLPGAPIVHLATHGLAYGSEARVRETYVALAADGVNDGFLTLGELMDDPALGLRAELVVLSACQTGLGDLKEAEGTVGLQRGLLARGARSVLVSLWSVDDRATAALMEAFYRHWLDDGDRPSKAEALRRAEGDIRAMPAWADPRYWAAFQLVGAR